MSAVTYHRDTETPRTPRLILASASPRRAALLRAAGFEFDVMPSTIADAIDVEETPDGYVRRMALAKVSDVSGRAGDRPVLAAQTIVVCDGRILDRPAGAEAARDMLKALSGRDHVVTTAVCLAAQVDGTRQTRTLVERTTVTMAGLSDAEIAWYVASGEPAAHRGGYAIDGLGSRFVKRISGSCSNAAGVPVAAVYELCAAAGIQS